MKKIDVAVIDHKEVIVDDDGKHCHDDCDNLCFTMEEFEAMSKLDDGVLNFCALVHDELEKDEIGFKRHDGCFAAERKANS
jgi:hypothetical protein